MDIMRDWIGIKFNELGKTKGVLAGHLGRSPARMTECTKGRRELQSSEIITFSEFLDLSDIKILLLPTDPNSELESLEISNVIPSQRVLGTIPFPGEVAAGLWREHDNTAQNLNKSFECAPTTFATAYPKELQFVMIARGESLNRVAQGGSTLHYLEHINGGSWEIADRVLVIVQKSKGK